MLRLLCLCGILGAPARADIVDRIAVGVGNSVITTGDIEREIRVTAFLNGTKPDFSPATRRATAERLVEQQLVRKELEISSYPAPAASAGAAALADFRKSHFPQDAAFQHALEADGLTAEEVQNELLWQLTLLRFIDVRFRPAVQVTEQDIRNYFEKTVKPVVEKSHPGKPVSLDEYRDRIRETLTGQRADQELDNWLKEARQRTEIVYHPEAFQ
jgi:peptidyl-prolyl cis-trans isomerase SurA